jgi:hypothetical protein
MDTQARLLRSVSVPVILPYITDEEKAEGMATVTGLTPETEYTATLLNGTVIRGLKTFDYRN